MDLTLAAAGAATAADPLDVFGEHPWEAAQRRQDEAEANWWQDNRQRADEAFLDPQKAFPDIEQGFADSVDTQRMMAANDDLLRLYRGGEDPPSDDFGRYLDRLKIAMTEFNGEGADSEEEFFAAAKKYAAKRVDEREFSKKLRAFAADDATLPTGEGTGLAGFMKAAASMPGYDPEKAADYAEEWTQARREHAERIEPIREQITHAWRAMRTGTEPDQKILASIPDELFPDFLGTLRLRAETLGDEEKEKFLAGMRKDFGRTVENYYRQAGETGMEYGIPIGFSQAVTGSPAPSGVSIDTQRELAGMGAAASADFARGRNRAHEVRRIFSTSYDPIDYVKGFGWAQKIPGVTATSLTMAVPFLGTPTMAASMAGAAQESAYLKARDAGMSEQDAGGYASAIAPAVAVPQAILEKIGFGIWARKLPAVNAVLTKMDDAIVNRGLRFLTKTAAISTAETAIEVAQDLTENAVQDIAAALYSDLPDVDWNQELSGAWRSIPEIAGSMIVLSLFGAAGGLSAEARAQAFQSHTDRQLTAAGLTPDAIRNIRNASGPASTVAAVEAGWQSRDPNSPEAKAAAEAEAAAAKARAEAMAALRASGAMPSIVVGNGKFTVLDGETREEVGTAATVGDAWRIAQAHSDFLADLHGDAVAYMATMLEGADFIAKLDKDTTTELDLGTVMDRALVEAERPEMAARFAEQAALMEKARGGTGEISYTVNGWSETEIRDNLRQTTNRIFQGASVLTEFHEFTHGKRREARAAGRITRAEEIQFIRAIDQVLAGKTTKDGTRMAFLEDGLTDEQITEAMIDEAMSEIMEMEILRSREGGTKRRLPGRPGVVGVPKGFITRNLTAIARLAPQATEKFRAFIEAVRAHFGTAMSRALALKKAERDGKFDADSYDAFLAKMMGLDQADDFRNLTDQEAERIFDGQQIEEDDIPFSLSRMRGKNAIKFYTPIETPLGKVVGYEWQSKLIETDSGGTDGIVLKRVSDWDKATTNAETGRDIVHHFTIQKPDGTTSTVSLESTLKQAGANAKDIKAIISAARRLPIREAELEQLNADIAEYEKRYEAERRRVAYLTPPEPTWHESEFSSVQSRGQKELRVGDVFVAVLDPTKAIPYDRLEYGRNAWQSAQMDIGMKSPDYERRDALKRQIKKDKQKLAAANVKEQAANSGASFSLGRATVTPTAFTRAYQGAEGSPSVIGPAAFSIRAFHGTPHKVDRFSTDKIGTGEGAQAYGWGLYFAANRHIARWYRDTVSRRTRITLPKNIGAVDTGDGYAADPEFKARYVAALKDEDPKVIDADFNPQSGEWTVRRQNEDLKGVQMRFDPTLQSVLKEVMGRYPNHGLIRDEKMSKSLGEVVMKIDPNFERELLAAAQAADDSVRAVEYFDEDGSIIAWRAVDEITLTMQQAPTYAGVLAEVAGIHIGNLYTVTLKVEDEDLLDWDKPLSEQSEKVRKAVEDVFDIYFEISPHGKSERPAYEQNNQDRLPVGSLYGQLDLLTGSPAMASRELKAAGIRGIRYLDGNSRSDGQGSYNYVIFDEADIEIVEENGSPVDLGTGGFSLGRAWPENFPNVTISTTVGKMKSHPAYTAAKAGSAKDAFQVVNDLLKIDRIRELGRQFPGAIVAGLHAEEATGHNKLPEALAEAIAHHADLDLDEHIVIINTPKRTGSTAIHRLAARPELAGDVQAGRQYILADDVATQGGTLSEARAYIEERGGQVVAAVTMAAAQGGTVLAMTPKTKLALQEKFGEDALHEFAAANGLYQGQWQAFTNSEALAILRYAKLETAADAILAARQAAGAPGIPAATPTNGPLIQGSFDGFSLAPSREQVLAISTTGKLEGGQQVATGQPVEFQYIHNPDSALKYWGKPKKGDQFDRDFEPSARFMISTSDGREPMSPSSITGRVTFNNPIVVPIGQYREESSWKRVISKLFGNLRGKRLSNAIIAAGYDGIITMGKDGVAREIVDFTTYDESKAAYSLAPSRALDLMRMNALDRVRNPRRRAEIFRRMGDEFQRLKLAAERLELTSGTKRLRKSLLKEAAMREAKAREDFENDVYARHWELLSNEDLVKIKSQPLHAYLADPDSPLRGRLMSRAAAMKHRAELFGEDYKGGEWDGSDGLSRALFGGQLTPDQAAQELYDHGLISDPYPDTMWQALHSEQAMVAGMKERLAQVQAELRQARMDAKAETNAWLKHAVGKQEAEFNPRQEILRALASLEAILRPLPAPVRVKIGGYQQMARIAATEGQLAFLKEQIAKADKELDRWMRETLDKEFRDLLDKTRPERDEAGKRPRGKIGADIHDLFRSIEAAMFLDADETEAEATRLEALAEAERTTPEQAAHLTMEANMVRLVGNWRKASADRMETALAEATSAYAGGYMNAKIKAIQRKERNQVRREDLRKATGKTGNVMERIEAEAKTQGTKLGRLGEAMLSIFSFDQILSLVFGKDSATAKFFADWELRAANAKEDAIQRTHNRIEELLTDLAGGEYQGEVLRHKLATERTVKWTDWKGRQQDATELEAISLTLMWRQADGRRHMEGQIEEQADGSEVIQSDWHWTEQDIEAIEKQLSKEAKAIRLFLTESYAAEYDRINAVFSDLYGVNMPRHKDYSPIAVAPGQISGGQVMDPVSGTMQGPGLTPGSLKNRSHAAVAEPRRMDALQHFVAHTKQMEHFIAYATFANELMAVVNNREVGNAIEAKAGKEALAQIRGWADYFAQGGTRDAAAHLAASGWFQRGLDRISQMALVGRASVLAIQSVQLGAAAYQMPVGSYIKRLAKLTTGQLGWGTAIRSEYIQRRLAEMPPAVQQAMKGLVSGSPSRAKFYTAKLGRLISGADALFTAGTYAIIYDYQLTQAKAAGMANPEKFAEQEAIRLTDQVAQPMRAGARSMIEVTATNPAFRMMWAFASEPRQKIALTLHGALTGKGADRFKPAVVTWLVSGLAAAIVRAAIRDLRDDGEDDEVFDEKNWNPLRLGMMALSGPLGGLPIVGKEIEAAIYTAGGEYLPAGSLIGGPVKAVQVGRKIATGKGSWESAIKDAEAIMGGVGVADPNLAAITSWLHIARDVEGIIRNLTDD